MKKTKYLALTLILSLLCMNKTYAVCTEEAREEFEKIENQYKITTTFNSDDKTYNIKIEQADVSKFKYRFAIDYQYHCKKISNTVTECYGLKNGTTFYANIVGNTKICNEILKEEEIRLKKYNDFYGDPLCEGIEEFVLCQEIYDREIDRETFEKRINSYKASKEKIDKEKHEDNNKKNNEITTYIEENLIQTIIISCFIILIIISAIVGYKMIRKSRRLE